MDGVAGYPLLVPRRPLGVRNFPTPLAVMAIDMRLRGKALAVVPAYNEEATLGRVIASLCDNVPTFDILVIDDGSTDRTREVAAASGAKVLQMPFNLGIGGAVQAGFRFALENDYDYMVQVDGDGQHDPPEIQKLVDAMEEGSNDVIIGSRFLKDLEYVGPISRRAGIHIFAFLLSRFVGQKVTDPTSGFRLYNRRAIWVASCWPSPSTCTM